MIIRSDWIVLADIAYILSVVETFFSPLLGYFSLYAHITLLDGFNASFSQMFLLLVLLLKI